MVDSNPEKKSIHELVLDRIHKGEVTPRPRWYFMLQAGLFLVGSVTVALFILYLISFTLFAIHSNGLWFVPVFGWRGLRVFLASLPWLLILITFLFILILESLVYHYSFAYRRPLLYSAAAIIILTAAGGILVSNLPFHSQLLERAEHEELPLAGFFYREFGKSRFGNIHVGIVGSLFDRGLSITTRRGEILTITITPETRFPLGSDIVLGDKVVVFGERSANVVEAYGLRRIDAGVRPRRGGGVVRMLPIFFKAD